MTAAEAEELEDELSEYKFTKATVRVKAVIWAYAAGYIFNVLCFQIVI